MFGATVSTPLPLLLEVPLRLRLGLRLVPLPLSGVQIWRYDADIGVIEFFTALRVIFSAPVFLSR